MNDLEFNYITSKDYEKLFDLVKTQQIVCFVEDKSYKKDFGVSVMKVATNANLKDEKIITICTDKEAVIKTNHYMEKNTKLDFINQCKEAKLSYIEPTKDNA